MKFKPTRLFGIEQRHKPCYFIHENGEGFWFISHKERTVGEARILKEISTEIDALEVNSNWLLIEISKLHHDELFAQMQEKDFKISDEDINTLNKEEKERLIEIYVRTLIGDLDFSNPVIWKYKDRLEVNISKNRELFFEYQLRVVETLFKCRGITDPSIVIRDEKDIEKGIVLTSDIEDKEKHVIGLIEDFDYDTLSEKLTLKIYQYANQDFAGLKYETTAMLKEKAEQKEGEKQSPTNSNQPVEEEAQTENPKKTTILEPLIASEK